METQPEPTFRARVEGGKLILYQPEALREWLRFRFKEGADAKVIVRRYRKDRSNNQNKYYWAVPVKILADAFGYFPDEMHEALKFKFLRLTDGPLERTRSTASLSTVEKEEYLARIRTWALTEHGIRIPLPNEVDYEYEG
ncbi:MAG: hypothetical protein Q8Q08_12890 [Candidatus Omnitrophota bacterium]|nr:hypothetical protein [Candidatus Omnitrophota bacterium]